ncbi:MAG: hypothetical protein ACKVN8_03920 [Nitrosarchaeum sp.]|jgi:hypothetical protein|nr:hypothetical protein [Nitrosarchaeum sp.]
MVDNLKIRLDKIRKFSDSAKRRASLYTDMSKFEGKSTAQALRCTQRASAPGKKMQKIGVALVLAPEPVTTPIGIMLIAAGTIFAKKYNGATIHDIGHETKHTISTINDFKNTVM